MNDDQVRKDDQVRQVRRVSLNPATLLAPVPVVLVGCCGREGETNGKPNLITVAWAGTINSDPPMLSISIRKSRYSHRQIIETGECTINLVDQNLLKATDFCGVKSGEQVDKFAACHLTPVSIAGLSRAPAIAESPLSLGCKVRQVIELGSHDCFLLEVISVDAAPEMLDAENRLRLDQAGLVAYNHGDYWSLGEKLGFFGYSVASADVLARRMPASGTRSIKRKTGNELSQQPGHIQTHRKKKNPQDR